MPDGITHTRCGWIAVEDPANSPGTRGFQNNADYFNVSSSCILGYFTFWK